MSPTSPRAPVGHLDQADPVLGVSAGHVHAADLRAHGLIGRRAPGVRAGAAANVTADRDVRARPAPPAPAHPRDRLRRGPSRHLDRPSSTWSSCWPWPSWCGCCTRIRARPASCASPPSSCRCVWPGCWSPSPRRPLRHRRPAAPAAAARRDALRPGLAISLAEATGPHPERFAGAYAACRTVVLVLYAPASLTLGSPARAARPVHHHRARGEHRGGGRVGDRHRVARGVRRRRGRRVRARRGTVVDLPSATSRARSRSGTSGRPASSTTATCRSWWAHGHGHRHRARQRGGRRGDAARRRALGAVGRGGHDPGSDAADRGGLPGDPASPARRPAARARIAGALLVGALGDGLHAAATVGILAIGVIALAVTGLLLARPAVTAAGRSTSPPRLG